MKLKNLLLTSIAAVLMAIAPLIVNQTACIWLFGEPECPESLKNTK